MWQQIDKRNFCKFLALTNFIAYNFGYHTHEKALMMVYVPLLFSAESQYAKSRVHLLGIVMVWSFMPLIPGLEGCLIKDSILLAQVCHLPLFYGYNETTQVEGRGLAMRVLTYCTLVLMACVQVAELLGIWLLDPTSEAKKYIYELTVSCSCAIVLQIVFVDLYVEVLRQPAKKERTTA